MHYSQARETWTPVSIEDCQRNNRLQIEHGLRAAGVDTLRLVVTDLRARIAREQAAPDAARTLAIAERELSRKEGING